MTRTPQHQVAGGDRPAWKPVMTSTEADRWAANSIFPAPVFHVTTEGAAAAIRRTGFDLSERRWGRVWGIGIYAATDAATLDIYRTIAGPNCEVLELRVNVMRILPLRIAASRHRPPLEYLLTRLPDGMGRFVEARLRLTDVAEAIRQVVVAAGYDALEIVEASFTPAVGGNQLVVYDPRSVVVIDDNAGT
jgi:hypothetical protein